MTNKNLRDYLDFQEDWEMKNISTSYDASSIQKVTDKFNKDSQLY